jgi:glutamate-1-semialdehyde aminotransferase
LNTAASEALFQRGLEVLVEGVLRLAWARDFRNLPCATSHGSGARLYDVDGNEYIDWMMPSARCRLATRIRKSSPPSCAK